MIDRQAIFDTAITAVIKQGVPSMGDICDGVVWDDKGKIPVLGKVACMYRGPNETKCAIGHLIPDDAYDTLIEGASVVDPRVSHRLANSLDIPQNEITANGGFFTSLQLIHDDAAILSRKQHRNFVELVREQAETFAFRFNLKMDTINAVA
jgi:hypothetical protein